jgi:hypothetical protein
MVLGSYETNFLEKMFFWIRAGIWHCYKTLLLQGSKTRRDLKFGAKIAGISPI